ncbi:MAG: class I SAM-dependent methyltransferase [Bacteroidia bacterium]|nr:class I SAM-dependent methyltransferase [Bacteroidia bacterium]
MLSPEQKKNLRSDLFRHLDGIGVAPTAYALHQQGVTDFLLEQKQVDLGSLATRFKANEGYLNVALRILCSQGWLTQSVDNEGNTVTFSTHALSTFAFSHFHLYQDVVDLLKYSEQFHPRKFEVQPFLKLERIVNRYRENYRLNFSENPTEKAIQQQILKHIEGIMVGPSTVHLGMNGMFHKYFMQASFKPEEFHNDAENFGKLLDMFTHLGWFKKRNSTYQFTETGLFFAKRATAYGVTVSYIPTFRALGELIFGDAEFLRKQQTGAGEVHVDRAMNVWGSGGAHSGYFKVVDEMILQIFNRPISEQPRGILDMGCGNGAFLQHLFEVIESRTLRGKMLEEHPLLLIGADYNQEALKITRANLIQADIWAKVVWGDIGNPALLAENLREDYDIDLRELLNVRTFLDHNRIWQEPETVNSDQLSASEGAFASRGKRLSNNRVEASLVEHFQKWKPFVDKFGLLLIELHTVKPGLVAQNLGKTAVTAYDATHGFSDQYIVELSVFLQALQNAGLYPDPAMHRKFPDSELASVSINLFRGEKGIS